MLEKSRFANESRLEACYLCPTRSETVVSGSTIDTDTVRLVSS